MTLSKQDAAKFEAAMKANPESLYVKTVQTLMDIYHEDRLVIFTLLSVLGAYLQNIEFSEIEKEQHVMMVEQLYIDYDIHKPEDLVDNINNCIANINSSKLRHTVGSVQ